MILCFVKVVPTGIEPVTQGFSVLCSTNWAMAPWFCVCKDRSKTWISKIIGAKKRKNNFLWKKTVFLLQVLKLYLPLQPQTTNKRCNRNVAQLVAHYVRDVGVGRSSRLIPTKSGRWFLSFAAFSYYSPCINNSVIILCDMRLFISLQVIGWKRWRGD